MYVGIKEDIESTNDDYILETMIGDVSSPYNIQVFIIGVHNVTIRLAF